MLDVINKLCLGLGIIDSIPQKPTQNSQGAGVLSNIFNTLAKKTQTSNSPVAPVTNNVSNQPNSAGNITPQVKPSSNNSNSQTNKTQTIDIRSLLQQKDTKEWIKIVRDYNIPSGKDDFVQFVTFLQEYSGNEYIGRVCNEKLEECRKRAMVVYADDSLLSRMLCYGEYKKKLDRQAKALVIFKKFLSVLWKVGILAVFIGLIVFGVEKCKRHNEEEAIQEQQQLEIAKAEAIILIDAEEHRLDSIVSRLPKPSRANYTECKNRVTALSWNQVECYRDKALIEYQDEKKMKMLSRVNEYIYKLQRIEPNQWLEGYTGYENDNFVKTIKPYDW